MENRVHGEGEPGQVNKLQTQILLLYKGYLFSSSSPVDTVISSSNGIRLALPGVLAHDIPIRHWLRNHRLLQQAVKQHPA